MRLDDLEAEVVASVDGFGGGYRTSHNVKRASKAAGRICTDSSNGVIEGR